MSAGLVLAALDFPGVQVQIMAWPREDLDRTRRDSSSRKLHDDLRIRRSFENAVTGWVRFDFHNCGFAVQQLAADDDALRGVCERARDISFALATWHDFDHQGALQLLDTYKVFVRPKWKPD